MTEHLQIEGLEVLIDGPEDRPGADTVVMLHGWPDTAALWQATVAALSPHYRCVRFTWPGFGVQDSERLVPLAELTRRLHAVVQAVSLGDFRRMLRKAP